MSLARHAARGAAWNFASILVERATGFAILAMLLRLVPAGDVGLVAIAGAISELVRVSANSGVSAQVQASPGDLAIEAGAFWSQLLSALVFMAALWLAAPWAATLYGLPGLSAVLRVLALSVVMTCFLIVPSARLASQFRFRAIGMISFGSTLTGGACAVILALAGHGAAALVAQRLAGVVFYAAASSAAARWRPPPPPSIAVLAASFRFSLPLMQAAFTDYLALSGYVMLAGLYMPVQILAQFRIAQRLLELLQELAFLPARKLVLPVLGALRGDAPRRQEALRQMLEALMMGMFFLSAVSGAAAQPLILLMFGPGWVQAAPVFAALSLAAPALALYGMINPMLAASGQVRLVSRYGWANAASILIICWLAAPHGLVALGWALAARGLLGAALFLAALRQGDYGPAWPVLRKFGVMLAGMAGARLAAYGVAAVLPAGHEALALAALAGSAALVFMAIICAVTPRQVMLLARRLRQALLSRPAML